MRLHTIQKHGQTNIPQVALIHTASKTADLLIKSGCNTDGVEAILSKIHQLSSWDVLKDYNLLKREYHTVSEVPKITEPQNM